MVARVSHAILRVLIVGAALAGTYWEPLLEIKAHRDFEIRALLTNHPTQRWVDFVLSFTVCDLEATIEAQDALFAPLADWLLEDILQD